MFLRSVGQYVDVLVEIVSIRVETPALRNNLQVLLLSIYCFVCFMFHTLLVSA